MDESSHEPLIVWQILRRHFVRIVLVAVAAVAIYGMLIVWTTDRREMWIARELGSQGGTIHLFYAGPDWIPQSVKGRFSLYVRIRVVDIYNKQVTDAGLKHLKGLTNLESLNLNNTQVTDAGLEHIKGLTTLTNLDLSSTRVTAEGRTKLRTALPNCKIVPEW